LESLNARVVGVSSDKPANQIKFVKKYGLTFPLIPDPDKTIIDAYGSRQVLGITATRSTFLVDPLGRIAHVWPSVKVEGHVDDVIETIGRMTEGASQ